MKLILFIVSLALTPLALAQGAGTCPSGMNSAWTCNQRPGDGSNTEQGVYWAGNLALTSGTLVMTETNTPSRTASGTYLAADVPTGAFISCSGSGNPGTYSCTTTYSGGRVMWTSFNQQYGDFQIKAKLGSGWPAIWMLGSNCQAAEINGPSSISPCSWDNAGSREIDIAEGNLVAPGTTSVLQNALSADLGNFSFTASGLTDVTANYHIYEVIVASTGITWKIDGSTTNATTGTPNFNDHFWLVINEAIGGTRGGTPTSFTYPNTQTVDWVKVCSQACGNGTSGAADPTFGTFFDDFVAVATPTASPVAGTYVGARTITLSTATAGATICYTTDGSTPTANGAGTCTHGTTYSSTFTVTLGTTVVQAIGSLSGDTDSGVLGATYVITAPSPSSTTGTWSNGAKFQ